MRVDWAVVLQLDDDRRTSTHASRIYKKLSFLSKAVLRVMFLVFEKYKGDSSRCIPGMRLLRALLEVLPDSRLIEEIHTYLRGLERLNKNFVSSAEAKYTAMRNSGRLEQRRIATQRVTKTEFVAGYGHPDFRKSRSDQVCRSVTMFVFQNVPSSCACLSFR